MPLYCPKSASELNQTQSYSYRCGQELNQLKSDTNSSTSNSFISAHSLVNSPKPFESRIYAKPYDYLAPSIICLIFSLMLCLAFNIPFCIIGIIYASRMNGQYERRQFIAAERSAKIAKNMLICSAALTGIALLCFLLFLIYLYNLAP